jgi:hypothetical protein
LGLAPNAFKYGQNIVIKSTEKDWNNLRMAQVEETRFQNSRVNNYPIKFFIHLRPNSAARMEP